MFFWLILEKWNYAIFYFFYFHELIKVTINFKNIKSKKFTKSLSSIQLLFPLFLPREFHDHFNNLLLRMCTVFVFHRVPKFFSSLWKLNLVLRWQGFFVLGNQQYFVPSIVLDLHIWWIINGGPALVFLSNPLLEPLTPCVSLILLNWVHNRFTLWQYIPPFDS